MMAFHIQSNTCPWLWLKTKNNFRNRSFYFFNLFSLKSRHLMPSTTSFLLKVNINLWNWSFFLFDIVSSISICILSPSFLVLFKAKVLKACHVNTARKSFSTQAKIILWNLLNSFWFSFFPQILVFLWVSCVSVDPCCYHDWTNNNFPNIPSSFSQHWWCYSFIMVLII